MVGRVRRLAVPAHRYDTRRLDERQDCRNRFPDRFADVLSGAARGRPDRRGDGGHG